MKQVRGLCFLGKHAETVALGERVIQLLPSDEEIEGTALEIKLEILAKLGQESFAGYVGWEWGVEGLALFLC